MKKTYVISLMIFLNLIMISSLDILSCTVAVISGKATEDGRPLLWKNRDSSKDENRVIYFKGEKYNFLGLVNSEDSDGKEVFAGVNSAGFCIMNSASLNLNIELKKKEVEDKSYKMPKDDEGYFMKRALEVCATVEEFEQFIKDSSGKYGIEANFGVIDAQGGAAFFETDINGSVKFDVNDPRLAPEGYILRTNYSFTGETNKGAGYIRFDRATELFHKRSATGSITLEWILKTASRDMVNSMTGIDPLAGILPANSNDRRMFHMNDCLVRRSATSTLLFKGVLPGEDPAGTIMWTRLGHPLCSVALPLWAQGEDGSALCMGEKSAPIDRFALILLKKIFPYEGGNRYQYMDIAPVINRNGDGYLDNLVSIEDVIIKSTVRKLSGVKKGSEKYKEIQSSIEATAKALLMHYFPEEYAEAGIQ